MSAADDDALIDALLVIYHKARAASDDAATDPAAQHYADGVGDLAGFVWARLTHRHTLNLTEDEMSSLGATNGQLAEILERRS